MILGSNIISKRDIDFNIKVGKILSSSLSVESYLVMFIRDYFMNQQGEKSFFFEDIILNKQGFKQNKKAAGLGGKIAGDERKKLEIEAGEKVITPENYLQESETLKRKKLITGKNSKNG